jgi:hypothetical protein
VVDVPVLVVDDWNRRLVTLEIKKEKEGKNGSVSFLPFEAK